MYWVLKNFYAIEGIDGMGKTTAINALKDLCCIEHRNDVVFTEEPSKSAAGFLARMLIESGGKADPVLLSYLFAADRNSHLYGEGGILDMVKKEGKKVFTDRYFFSSMAYQGFSTGSLAGGHSVNEQLVNKLNEDFPFPEAVFYLEADPHVALERQKERGREEVPIDRLLALHDRYLSYLQLLDEHGPRKMKIVRIDATLPPRDIAPKIWKVAFGEGAIEDDSGR